MPRLNQRVPGNTRFPNNRKRQGRIFGAPRPNLRFVSRKLLFPGSRKGSRTNKGYFPDKRNHSIINYDLIINSSIELINCHLLRMLLCYEFLMIFICCVVACYDFPIHGVLGSYFLLHKLSALALLRYGCFGNQLLGLGAPR